MLQFLLSFLLVYRFGASATCFWHSLLLYNYPEWSWAMKSQNGWCIQCYDAQQIIMYEIRQSTSTIWYFVAHSVILYSFSEHKRVNALLLTSARIFVSSQFSTQHIILYVPHVSVSFRVFRQFFGCYTHTHTHGKFKTLILLVNIKLHMRLTRNKCGEFPYTSLNFRFSFAQPNLLL